MLSRINHGWIARLGCVLLTLVVVLGSGCRRKVEEYVPEPQLAESAVRRALSAWQAGEPAGPIADTKPAIFVTDTNRNPKQRLQSFEILGETPGRSGRTYVVELALDAPAENVPAEKVKAEKVKAEKVPAEKVPAEKVPAEKVKAEKVKAEKVKAEYIVVGIDPLWVFRREDYELLMHWDHYMPEEAADAQTAETQSANNAANSSGKK